MTLREQLIVAENQANATVPRRKGRAAPEWCIFAKGAGCCSRKFECRREADLVRVVGPRECNPDCPRAVPTLRIGAVITAWNEGDEVKKTVESLAASIRDERTRLWIYVVDDGSTDKSCDGLGIGKVLRHEQPQGVGRSRNFGAHQALVDDADVLTFHDAHMRFEAPKGWAHPWGPLEHLARRALQERCIVSSASIGMKEGSTRFWLCDLFYNAKDGLQPKWRCVGGRQQPTEEWPLSPCMMGAGYVMSADTARALVEPTGALWEDTAGRWGFSEQALSVKAFLMDIPVRFSRDVWLRHLYRKSNPVQSAGAENWRNVTRSMFVLLGQQLFDERFRVFCEARIGKQAVEEILKGVPQVDASLAWDVQRTKIWTHLCGKRALTDETHPELAGLVGDLAPLGEPEKILVWRPGEHLSWMREALPHADIRCLDFNAARLATWRPWCKAHKVQLHAVSPDKDYYERPRAWGLQFDLVVIAGAVQARCKAVAETLLAPGGGGRPSGRIVMAPSGLRGQMADEHVKLEDALADKLTKKVGPIPARLKPAGETSRSDQPDVAQPLPAEAGPPPVLSPAEGAGDSVAGVAPAPSPVVPSADKPVATIALLNYKRPENIPIILDALAAQTVPVQVYIWNNAGTLHSVQWERPLVKLWVTPKHNLGCFPRWQMLSWADTEFVGTIDDDLCPKPELIERAIAACREKCPDGLVGAFGMNTVEGKSYRNAQHIHGPKEDRHVEIVKGRFLLFRRQLLERIPLSPPVWNEDEPMAFRCDDIFLSLSIGAGNLASPEHLIPGSLRGHWKEQGGQKVALASQRGHYQLRDKAIAHLRTWLNAREAS